MRHIQIPGTRVLSMSPDGRSIAALRPMVGFQRDGQLCVFDVATLAETACGSLAPLDAGIRPDSIVWSPDSAHLVMTEQAFMYLRDGDLWLMDATTGVLSNLDDDGFSGGILGDPKAPAIFTIDASPTFTADGSAVTFSRSTFRDGTASGNDIATVPITGGEAEHLVDVSQYAPGVAYFGMRWAGDDTTLYYSLNDVSADSPINGIWSIGADGMDNRLLTGTTDPQVADPAIVQVSSDGSRLLAWHPRTRGQIQPIYELSLIDAASGAASPLTPDAGVLTARGARIEAATFSPDGAWLLELTRGTDPDHQVLLRNLEKGVVVPLVANGLDNAGLPQWGIAPTWSSDGTVLIPGGGALDEATLLAIEVPPSE